MFGLMLTAAVVGLAWKNGRATACAVVAVMLGVTIAGSNGALSGPSRELLGAVRTSLGSVGSSLFGGKP